MHAIKLKVKKASGDYDVGCSKMLGDPVLPEGMLEELPPTAMFLMQIKLEDIKDLDVENKLPHKGYLYFFLDAEDAGLLIECIVRPIRSSPLCRRILEASSVVDVLVVEQCGRIDRKSVV